MDLPPPRNFRGETTERGSVILTLDPSQKSVSRQYISQSQTEFNPQVAQFVFEDLEIFSIVVQNICTLSSQAVVKQ